MCSECMLFRFGHFKRTIRQKMKSIISVGCGTVGYATCLSLSSLGHSIIGIDECVTARSRMIKAGFPCYSTHEVMGGKSVENATVDAILIALPTPFCTHTNTLSVASIMSSLPLVSHFIRSRPSSSSLLIILQSTVPMGTSRNFFKALEAQNSEEDSHFHMIYHPEFLRADQSENDALHPIKQIFGLVDGKPVMDSLFCENVLQEIFSPIGSSRSPITILGSAEEAEYLKLVHNFSNAMRISFSNCCGRLASMLSLELDREIDASRVLSIVSDTAESFYNSKYGIQTGYPYSGACLPKDVQYFMTLTDQQPYQQFLQSVHLINEQERFNQPPE